MSAVVEKKGLVYGENPFSSYQNDELRYEIEYQSFLGWWAKNADRFNNFSFRVDNQTDLFLDQIRNGNLEIALSQLRMDLYGYYLEYIRQEGIIPFSLRFNPSGRVVGDFYGDKSIVEIVDPKERDGIVREAMIDLEERLKGLKESEIIFRVSPSGWTGLGYDYIETQAQVLWKDKDRFRGLTIRTQINLDEILALFSSLGVDISSGFNDEKDIIKFVTSLNITLPYSSWEFIQFLTERFGNCDHQGKELKVQISDWWGNDGDFARFDGIVGLVKFLEKKIKNLVDRGYSGEEIREELRRLIGFVLMGMAGGSRDNFVQERVFSEDTQFLPAIFYDQVFEHLQSLPGCAGGGSGNVGEFMLTSFGTVGVAETDRYGSREFECPHCRKTVLRPKDALLEKCPHCGKDVSC